MRNNQSQSEIFYNTRVKEREKNFFQKTYLFQERLLKGPGGTQYR